MLHGQVIKKFNTLITFPDTTLIGIEISSVPSGPGRKTPTLHQFKLGTSLKYALKKPCFTHVRKSSWTDTILYMEITLSDINDTVALF